MVRIRLPPAERLCLTQTRPLPVENRGFRAGVRRSPYTHHLPRAWNRPVSSVHWRKHCPYGWS